MQTMKVFVLCIIFLYKQDIVSATPQVDTIPGLTRLDSAVHFLVVGDWGTQGSPTQRKVAAAMAAVAKDLGASFIISTGDNFYPAGVSSVHDPQWLNTFEEVYQAASLQTPWLAVLGNHDYTLNPDAQVAYTYENKRWYMPGRYYDTSIAIGKDSLLLVFLDTEPIERQLRGLAADTSKYKDTYVNEQLTWLENTLSSSKSKWKLVAAHHPLHTGGSRRHNKRIKKLRALIQPVLHANNVDFYVSGHEHHLELLKPKGPTTFIISGAGSETRHVGWLKRFRRFAARKKGFASISISGKNCLIQFISDKQELLFKHSLQILTP